MSDQILEELIKIRQLLERQQTQPTKRLCSCPPYTVCMNVACPYSYRVT